MADIVEFGPEHRAWARELLSASWGSPVVVTRGRLYEADRLPGFVALAEGCPQGLATYRIEGEECEIVTLDSRAERRGLGSALLEAVRQAAQAAGCRRLWLITTNDNTRALRFYQRRGLEIAALHRGAIAESRRLKPGIPEIGEDGIPIRDEIELELRL